MNFTLNSKDYMDYIVAVNRELNETIGQTCTWALRNSLKKRKDWRPWT